MAFTPETALEYIRRAQKQNRIGHAYLISGPAGSGKRRFVEDVARLVNPADGGQIHIAEPESKSRRIVIEQVRALEHSLQMRSANGRRKIAAIIDADGEVSFSNDAEAKPDMLGSSFAFGPPVRSKANKKLASQAGWGARTSGAPPSSGC